MTTLNVWITEVTDAAAGTRLAVKDNVDVAGLPTTCAHPAFAYTPSTSATAVQRLVDAGAVVVGKANLDQFATGLVGTRSPYGVVANPHVPDRVAGGSSSGSAAAVALGLADLAIGTDTAGSGRVPAALCGVVGLKPTVGLVPNDGVVPACASLDCVSIFARTVGEAAEALDRIAGGARPIPTGTPVAPTGSLRIGVPPASQLWALDDHAAAAWDRAGKELDALGTVVEVDLTAYLQAGQLVYGPAYLPERHAAVGRFLAAHPDGADPSVAEIIAWGAEVDAAASAAERLRLPALAASVARWWADVDVVAIPTVGEAPTIDAVAADPIGINRRLGTFASGANPLDLCAAAVPCGFRDDGIPFGVTFLGPAFADPVVALAAARLAGEPDPPPPSWAGWTDIAVVGAHLAGQPLNWQLTDRGGHLVKAIATAPTYKLVALPTEPPKPGMVRVAEGGAAIATEVWRLPTDGFGSFVAAIPQPLGIGTVDLADGTQVHGFLCEDIATDGAPDITHHGGWLAYLAQT
ncbi:MAG: aspartyl-tRNA(Asn)/glutamyl-tRNA (Gln) amidotransferase subunit [Actinomycetia bacterium]|nr:aspartyl-tRNA(Asn)/glutamyl-tRNA (Gln) amidotransferase subunit [Actinomycetes bacterium]